MNEEENHSVDYSARRRIVEDERGDELLQEKARTKEKRRNINPWSSARRKTEDAVLRQQHNRKRNKTTMMFVGSLPSFAFPNLIDGC